MFPNFVSRKLKLHQKYTKTNHPNYALFKMGRSWIHRLNFESKLNIKDTFKINL